MANRNYPNNYFAWYNDDDRLAILERVTSTDASQTHKEMWDSVQSGGDLSGTITSFADAGSGNVTVSSTGHGLISGDRISITSSPDADYDGNYAITYVGANSFTIIASYLAEASGTWTSLFVDNGLRVTFHSKYEEVNAVSDDLKTGAGLDSGMHHGLVYYVKFRLFQDMGDLQQAEYYRKLFQEIFTKYPSRKSGVRYLQVPRV